MQNRNLTVQRLRANTYSPESMADQHKNQSKVHFKKVLKKAETSYNNQKRFAKPILSWLMRSNPNRTLTDGEADDLIVIWSFGFFHWFHEGPGIRVRLARKRHMAWSGADQSHHFAHCQCIKRHQGTLIWARRFFSILYSRSGSLTSLLRSTQIIRKGKQFGGKLIGIE